MSELFTTVIQTKNRKSAEPDEVNIEIIKHLKQRQIYISNVQHNNQYKNHADGI